MRFRRHEDGSLGQVADGVDSYFHALVDSWILPGGDVAVGLLAAPVEHIAPIPIAMAGMVGMNQLPMTHAGWGKEGPGHNQGPRTQLLLCDNTLRSATSLSIQFDSATQNGCGVNVHDSGSPVLLERDGELRTIGVVGTTSNAANYHRYLGDTTLPWLDTPFDGTDLYVEADVAPVVLGPSRELEVALRPALAGLGGPVTARLDLVLLGSDGPVQRWGRATSFDATRDWIYPTLQVDRGCRTAPTGSASRPIGLTGSPSP